MAQLFHLSGRAYENSSGVPYALAKAYFYVTGTTTAQDTYTAAGLGVANANPVVAGADGVFGDIYLAAKRYKVVIKDADDNTLRTWDPIDATSQLIAASAAPSPTYPFLRYHNTTDGFVYRRNAADNAWINEGAVDSVGNTASVTEVLTGTETAKFVTPDSLAAIWQRGSNITPSAGTVSLPAAGGGVFNIAAGNFSAISTGQGGRTVIFVFGGVSVITHNATSLRLPGAANITTAANDVAVFVNEAAADASGANWACTSFVKYTGSPVNIADQLGTQAEAETNTSTTKTLSIANLKYHPAMTKCLAHVSYSAGTPTLNESLNITSITDTNTGRLTITIATDFSSATYPYQCSSEAPSGGSELFTNVRTGTQAAGSLEITTQNSGGVDTDPAVITFAAWGDFT